MQEANAEKIQNWAYYGTKCSVEIWSDVVINWQLLTMGLWQTIWENIAMKVKDNGYNLIV